MSAQGPPSVDHPVPFTARSRTPAYNPPSTHFLNRMQTKASDLTVSSDLSDRIRRIWMGPEQPEEAVASLKDVKGTSLEGLVRVATDPSVDLEVRSSAVWLLGRLKMLGSFKKAEALYPLLGALADRNPGVLSDRRAAGRLIEVMHGDPDAMARQLAAQSLGELHSPKAIRALREVFTDQGQESRLRGAAAEALGASFTYESVPELVAGLTDPSPEVRFWSAYAVGFMKVESAVPELERLVSGDDAEVPGWWSVSKEAAWAIAEIRGAPIETEGQ